MIRAGDGRRMRETVRSTGVRHRQGIRLERYESEGVDHESSGTKARQYTYVSGYEEITENKA